MSLRDTVHSLNRVCSFLFNTDVYLSGDITERETDNCVPNITLLMCTETNSCWTDCQLIQMLSAVIFAAHLSFKKERKKKKRTAIDTFPRVFPHFFEGNPVQTKGDGSEGNFPKISTILDWQAVLKLRPPKGSDGVFGLAAPTALRLSVIPAIGLHWQTPSLLGFQHGKTNKCWQICRSGKVSSCKIYLCRLEKNGCKTRPFGHSLEPCTSGSGDPRAQFFVWSPFLSCRGGILVIKNHTQSLCLMWDKNMHSSLKMNSAIFAPKLSTWESNNPHSRISPRLRTAQFIVERATRLWQYLVQDYGNPILFLW